MNEENCNKADKGLPVKNGDATDFRHSLEVVLDRRFFRVTLRVRKCSVEVNVTLKINEIFYSIQGESTHQGLPYIFVRESGCNLRCRYCDTTYAYDEGEQMELSTIVKAVRSLTSREVAPRVLITGGEPLMQADTPKLIGLLNDEGYRVSVETNGSLDIRVVPPESAKRIVDFKCPSSGCCDKNLLDNHKYMCESDEAKFVIANRGDYDWARNTVRELNMLAKHEVLFSPVFGELMPSALARWILEDDIQVRLQLQLHKIIWPETTKGV